MENIDKLRNEAKSYAFAKKGYGTRERLLDIADEIEREIAEKYMELPVDADGVPIRVGDEVVLNIDGKKHSVQFVAQHCFLPASPITYYMGAGCRHVKHDPVNELLNSFLEEYDASIRPDEEIIARYAAKIREAVSADE